MTYEQGRPSGWELIDDEECRRATAIVERVGRRWSSGILLALARGASRFTEIVAHVDGLSDRVLAARLRELEQIGLVDRIVEPTTPVSVRYRLTARGKDLLASLQPSTAASARDASNNRGRSYTEDLVRTHSCQGRGASRTFSSCALILGADRQGRRQEGFR